MSPNTIAFIIAPLSVPIFAFFASDTFHSIVFLIWTAASYIGTIIFGYPYVCFLEKKGKLTAPIICAGSVFFGALYGVIVGFASFVGTDINFHRGVSTLFSMFGLAAMLFGAFYGAIVGVIFGLIRYAAIKQSAT